MGIERPAIIRQTGRSNKDRFFMETLMKYKGEKAAVVNGKLSKEFKEFLDKRISEIKR